MNPANIKKIEEMRLAIAKLHIERAMGNMKNSNEIRNKQKEIARILSSGIMPVTTKVEDKSKKGKKSL